MSLLQDHIDSFVDTLLDGADDPEAIIDMLRTSIDVAEHGRNLRIGDDDPNGRWNDNLVQFARLITEMCGVAVYVRADNMQFTVDLAALAEEMDLTDDQLDQLFTRAQDVWDKAKEQV